ncbi:MAG TPA: prenyltransferase, partial [Candidatus Eisenbacteria bacterium]|nr:prenyltransferase [Candidatus Eisenbacteria bacterium]
MKMLESPIRTGTVRPYRTRAQVSAMPGIHAADRSLLRGIWRLADPKVSIASFASITLGAAAAARDGSLHWEWLALTVLGIFAIEVAKNASGEVVDFSTGADQGVGPEDRSPFSGGKRVLVDNILTRTQTVVIAIACYLIGIAVGLAISAERHPGVLWLGLAGIWLAYFYHAPPIRLSYRGFGEIAVAAAYGPLIACGTYLVQRRDWSEAAFLASLPLGLLIAAFLWINEFPDVRADRAAGKRTLVVSLGPRAASYGYAALAVIAYALIAILPALGLPRSVWLGL